MDGYSKILKIITLKKMSMGHYKPYFDQKFDAYQEYRKEFVLKSYRKTSKKLQTSSYSKLFNDNSLRGVSAWLKEQASENDRKQFHTLFKKLGSTFENLSNVKNPYTADSEVDAYFHAASNFGHGVLTDKAIKSIATYFKDNKNKEDMDSFKKMMSSITSYQKHIQPQSHDHYEFKETTPHVVDQKKSRPIQQVASEKYAMTHNRPKTAPNVRPIIFPNEFTTTNTLSIVNHHPNTNSNTNNNTSCLTARPSTSHVQRMHDRVFNSKVPFAMAPSNIVTMPTSKTDFTRSNSKVQEYTKAQPAWKATTCPTASGGVVQPSFSVDSLVQKERREARRKLPAFSQTSKPSSQQAKKQDKMPTVALGKTTYYSTFQPQANIPSKPYHQPQLSKPFGDYGTVDFLTEYCKKYSSSKNKENISTNNKVK